MHTACACGKDLSCKTTGATKDRRISPHRRARDCPHRPTRETDAHKAHARGACCLPLSNYLSARGRAHGSEDEIVDDPINKRKTPLARGQAATQAPLAIPKTCPNTKDWAAAGEATLRRSSKRGAAAARSATSGVELKISVLLCCASITHAAWRHGFGFALPLILRAIILMMATPQYHCSTLASTSATPSARACMLGKAGGKNSAAYST